MIPAGTVLFYAPDDAEAESEARAYVARYKLIADDVKMARRAGGVVVEARRDVVLDEGN